METLVKTQVDERKRLQGIYEPLARPLGSLGNAGNLAVVFGQKRNNLIRFSVWFSFQDDGGGDETGAHKQSDTT